MTRRQRLTPLIVLAGLTLYVVLLLCLAACGSTTVPGHSSNATSTPTIAGRTIVTAKVKRLEIFNRPMDARSVRVLSNPNADGAPLVLLTKSEQAGWYQVMLPVPPNGSTGWVRASDVRASTTVYRVEVHTGSHQLLVYRGDQQVLMTRAGIGTKDTPTPGGEYFLTELLKTDSPDGPYGPYAYGISGQSTTLKSFNGQPPVIGLHGTNQPELLGKNVSHGCVRISNDAITKLTKLLPLGTPVEITST
jgi:lipoprotein-anchoring transpeptidase ErfK/SrfK